MNSAGLLLLLVKRKRTKTQSGPKTALKRSTMKFSSKSAIFLLAFVALLTIATANAGEQLLTTAAKETPTKGQRDLQQQPPSHYYSRQREPQKELHPIPPDLFTVPDKGLVVVIDDKHKGRHETRAPAIFVEGDEPKELLAESGDEPELLEEDMVFELYGEERGNASEQAKHTIKKQVRSNNETNTNKETNAADNEQHVTENQEEDDTNTMQQIKTQRKPSVLNAKKQQSDLSPEGQALLSQYSQTNVLKDENAVDNELNEFEQQGEDDTNAARPIKPRRKPSVTIENEEQSGAFLGEQTLLLQHEEFNFQPHLSKQETQEKPPQEEFNFFAQGAHDEELKNKTRGKSSTSAHLPTRMFNMAAKEANEEFSELEGTSSRVLVHYANREGRKLVLQVASKIHHDFADENVLAVDVESTDAIEELRQSAWIDLVEEDSLWTAQGYIESIVREEELRDDRYWQEQDPPREGSQSRNVRRRRRSERKLVEQIPYGIPMIQADQIEVGPYPVQVCIVDTGIGLDHPDIDPARADGIDRESDVDGQILHWNEDVRGHGTHVAGIMAAKSNNSLGVRGVGDVHVYVTRGLDNEGRAYESDIREAVEQCETAGAKIINLSLGGSKMSSAMKSICDRLYKKGFLIFAAAGNSGEWRLEYPASDPTVVSVSAVDSLEWYWANANYGPTQELMAPGVSIISTTWSEEFGYTYAEYSGTSMATPHASAAAAVLWSHRPECTNQQIRYALAYTAKDKGSEGCDSDFGYGIIQIKDALDFLNKYPCVDANWGRNHGSGNCTTIDEEPDFSITFPPSDSPSSNPTENPTASPTQSPTTSHPVANPTLRPTVSSTTKPTDKPTKGPTKPPTVAPTLPADPTNAPSTFTEDEVLTNPPDAGPTRSPTMVPTRSPTSSPTKKPAPTPSPTSKPTMSKESPTPEPITSPTSLPTSRPTRAPVTQPIVPRPTNEPTLPPIPTPTVTTRQPIFPPSETPTAPDLPRPTPPFIPTTPSDPRTSSPTVGIDLGEAEVTPFPAETTPVTPPPPAPSPSVPSLPTATETSTTASGGREWFRTSSGEMTTANAWPQGGGGNNRAIDSGNDNPGIFTSGSKSRRSGGSRSSRSQQKPQQRRPASAAEAAGNDQGPPNNNDNDSIPRNWFRSSSFNGVFNIYGRYNDSDDDDGRRRRRWNGE